MLSTMRIGPQNRALVWVLLLLLTASLLFAPVHLRNEYHPIQPPYLFDGLPLFGILFCIWMLLLLLLVFSKRDQGDRLSWESLALGCVFALLFLGFWVVITPYGSFADSIFNMGHVRWLMDEGTMPVGHQNLWYFDFPGMHLLVAALAELTGLGVFQTATLFLVFNALLFSGLLYILFVKLLKSNRLASLAVALAVLGSVMLVEKMRIFTPGALGYTLLAGFLVMLTRSETKLFGTTVSDRLLMLIVFSAMVISYFATPLLAALVLLGVYVVQTMAKAEEARANPATICLLLVTVMAWEIYWTWKLFHSLAGFLPRLWDDMLSGEFLSIPVTLAKVNVGGELPLWASMTRSFWLALLGFSTILALHSLFRVRQLSVAQKVASGGLLGVILLTILSVFGTHGGQQFTRFLLYAPLFSVPVLLMFLCRLGAWRRKGFALLAILVFGLALPTFLSSVNTVGTDAIYPYELSAGEFMKSSSPRRGEGATLFGLCYVSKAWVYYYAPDIRTRQVSEAAFYEGGEGEVWEETDKIVTAFEHEWAPRGTQKLFALSDKDATFYRHLLGVLPDNPNWEGLRAQLSTEDRIFTNGHLEMYASLSKPP